MGEQNTGPGTGEQDKGPDTTIPAEIIPRLTDVAARLAGMSQLDGPPTVTAVTTTQAKALQLLADGCLIPGSELVPVYVITMTGRFTPLRRAPGMKRAEGSALTAILDARTLHVLDVRISNQDDRALLPQLGPVTILPRQQHVAPGRADNPG